MAIAMSADWTGSVTEGDGGFAGGVDVERGGERDPVDHPGVHAVVRRGSITLLPLQLPS
jgi:hypothetical protein